MMEIRKLAEDKWKGYKLHFSYTTDGYYDFDVRGWAFGLVFHPYGEEREKSFEGELFEDWAESPSAFGAFEGEKLVGAVGCARESWNNRFRVTELLVDAPFRGRGIGSALLARAEEEGRRAGARMLVLETQTCNRRAIDFYRKNGFAPIGFDLCSYSDEDRERTEVRLEMGKHLAPAGKI